MLMMHEPSDIKNVKRQFGASKFLTLYDAKQTLLLVISSAKDVYVFTTVFSVTQTLVDIFMSFCLLH